MKRPIESVLIVCLCVSAAWLSQGTAQAQFRYNPYQVYAQAMATQHNMYAQQAYYNQAALTNYAAYVSTNPYANYYNPAYYSASYAAPVVAPYAGVNPYMPSAPGYGASENPYSPVDGALGNPYNPYNPYSPYGAGTGAGSALTGAANVIRAQGKLVNDWEDARLKREIALQAKLDTKKKAFDLDMYIKANTPTYTQEQEKNARVTLQRIRTNSLPGEVTSGKALNLMLDDLSKFPGKKISLEPLPVVENVLTHLNVTKTNFGMGLLRNEGKVVWPSALQDAKQRQDMDKQLQKLVKEANGGRIDNNVIKDVRTEIDRMGEELIKKVNEIPTAPYLDAKRFLKDLYESTRAIEQGEASTQTKFQRFVEGGRSVQEVADYMIKEGLKFGPAAAADEAAYRAVHSSLASYDIAMNSQLDTKE
jgi:hypothetical protein